VRLADPVDQATGLRRLFKPEPAFRALGVLGADGRATARACVALARGLGRRGARVMVLDEARPPHHVGGLLGILTRHTLSEAADRGLVDIVQPAGDGIVLLSAPDGLRALAGCPSRRCGKWPTTGGCGRRRRSGCWSMPAKAVRQPAWRPPPMTGCWCCPAPSRAWRTPTRS
jgi:hypothetical protein